MHRLVVNPDTTEAWELQLKPGPNQLGREPDNDLQIDHPSVSSVHCVIEVENGSVRLMDLGSANGTFVNSAQVDEATLNPGDHIQIGAVDLMLVERGETAVSSASAASAFEAPPVPPPISAVSAVNAFCRFHPKNPAHYYCSKCNRFFCGMCVSTRQGVGDGVRFCQHCGVACSPVRSEYTNQELPKTFFSLLPKALTYPLTEDGAVLLIAGTIFFVVIHYAQMLASFAGIFGFAAVMMLSVFGSGYLIAFMQDIVRTSGSGDKKMPDWPDFTDIGAEILPPIMQFVVTLLACFLPAIAMGVAYYFEQWFNPVFFAVAVILGCAVFPMAFLAVTMFDNIGALNPLLIVPALFRVPLEYLVTLVALAIIVVTEGLGQRLLEWILPIPIVPVVLSSLLSLYMLTVEMRILGLLHWCKREQLGWFNQ